MKIKYNDAVVSLCKTFFQYAVYGFALIGFFFILVFFAVKYGFTNERGIIDNQQQAFLQGTATPPTLGEKPVWADSEEWKTVKEAVTRDRGQIYKAAARMDVDPRNIVAVIAVEQLRLFFDNRELFKQVFAPLKILGTQIQFSWGVAGIKQETAIDAENHLNDATSPFYPGEQYTHALDFTTNDTDKERFERIVNEDDRYYSYLYTAVILKELETQWERAGFDITNRPEILSTLFNIGFTHSNPNPNPSSGGSSLTISGKQYSFGSLAAEFYYSDELTDLFPRK